MMHLKDIPGKNVATTASYLKGALVLLHNYKAVPTDTLGILNDTLTSADCDEFT